ncbi:MAG TPA: hypothetical protein VGC13_27805 [Longimicrobium sp.]|jgi:hypothetical protein|uniref:hypothetical protein n=1 Tax=Longimicrobium sp. TaxID=2029185 RepID=UPI002EDAD099
MAASNLTLFGALSSVLTGFPLSRVAPAVDPIGLPAQFLDFITRQVGQPLVQQLLDRYAAISQQQSDPSLQAPLVQQQIMADPALGPLARRVIRLWYLGTWYAEEPPTPGGSPKDQVVSMNAYTGGLAWDAIQAHPMGYSELHYGYWSTLPILPLPTLTGA